MDVYIAPVRVSVVIPCFNSVRWVADALDSVLRQTLPATEIILVDDGSTDGVVEFVRSTRPSVIVREQPHSGVASARNLGLSTATCEWVSFLDADDVWHPSRLQRLADFLRLHPEHRAVATDTMRFQLTPDTEDWRGGGRLVSNVEELWSPGHTPPLADIERVRWDRLSLDDLLIGNRFTTNPLVRREDLIAVGGFPTVVGVVEDWMAWIALATRVDWALMHDPTYFYLQRPRSLSQSTATDFCALVGLLGYTKAGGLPDADARTVDMDRAHYLARGALQWAIATGDPMAVRAVRGVLEALTTSRRTRLRQRLTRRWLSVAPGHPFVSRAIGAAARAVGLDPRGDYPNAV